MAMPRAWMRESKQEAVGPGLGKWTGLVSVLLLQLLLLAEPKPGRQEI